MRKILTFTLLLGGLIFTACDPHSSPAPTTTPTATIVPSPTVMPRTIVSTNTIQNKDGSTTVVTAYSDGSKTEVRTFRSGRLARVTRITDPSGARTVRANYRADESEVEIKDES